MAKKQRMKQPSKIKSPPRLSQVFKRRNISSAFLFASAVLFGFGGEQISSGTLLAPWLIAFAMLMVAIAIITNQDISNYINYHITKFWKRTTINGILCLIFFIPTLLYFQNIANDQREYLAKFPVYWGFLTPGNQPDPPSPSYELLNIPPQPADAFRVMLGDDSGIYIEYPVNNTIYLQNMPLVTIRTSSGGQVLLSANITDSNNQNITRIIDDEFKANPEYAFNPRQPDKHSLIVRDLTGAEIFVLKYINEKTIWIVGRFSLDDSHFVIVSPSGMIEFDELTQKNVFTRNIYLAGPIRSGLPIYLGYEIKE